MVSKNIIEEISNKLYKRFTTPQVVEAGNVLKIKLSGNKRKMLEQLIEKEGSGDYKKVSMLFSKKTIEIVKEVKKEKKEKEEIDVDTIKFVINSVIEQKKNRINIFDMKHDKFKKLMEEVIKKERYLVEIGDLLKEENVTYYELKYPFDVEKRKIKEKENEKVAMELIGKYHDNLLKLKIPSGVSIGEIKYYKRSKLDLEKDGSIEFNICWVKYFIHPEEYPGIKTREEYKKLIEFNEEIKKIEKNLHHEYKEKGFDFEFSRICINNSWERETARRKEKEEELIEKVKSKIRIKLEEKPIEMKVVDVGPIQFKRLIKNVAREQGINLNVGNYRGQSRTLPISYLEGKPKKHVIIKK